MLELHFDLWCHESTPNAGKSWSIGASDPTKINEMLQYVEDGAPGDGHVSIHGDLVSVGFPCGARQTALQRKASVFFEVGEEYEVSIADYDSLKRDVLSACESMAANQAMKSLSLDGSVK